MSKKHIISIAGRPGSGKSTTSKGVAAALGYRHYSTGDFFRQIGQEMGLDVLETNKAAAARGEIDQRVDDRQKFLGENEENFVIDARLAWFFIPDSFKVYLDLDLRVAAERILAGIDSARQASENIPQTPEEYAEVLKERLVSESTRYKSLYDADPSDLANYDLVVDTGINSIEEVVEVITEAYHSWCEKQN